MLDNITINPYQFTNLPLHFSSPLSYPFIPSNPNDIPQPIRKRLQSDLFIMQKSKKLPNITQKHNNIQLDPPIRRRNLSLSSNHQSTQRTNLEKDIRGTIRFKALARCYSKKNKLFLKSQKIKKARDLTKLCQESMLEYISLKNQVKNLQMFEENDRRSAEKNFIESQQASPKLSVRLLNMPINLSFKTKYEFMPTEHKLRLKTEPSPRKLLRISSIREAESKYDSGKPVILSPKKYNQLTLRQIVETEDEFSVQSQLYQKIKDFKEKIREGIEQHRFESSEYEPLKGW